MAARMQSAISPLTILVSLEFLLSTRNDPHLYCTIIYDSVSRAEIKDNRYDDIAKQHLKNPAWQIKNVIPKVLIFTRVGLDKYLQRLKMIRPGRETY